MVLLCTFKSSDVKMQPLPLHLLTVTLKPISFHQDIAFIVLGELRCFRYMFEYVFIVLGINFPHDGDE